jgi:hypothetical protein
MNAGDAALLHLALTGNARFARGRQVRLLDKRPPPR